MYSVLYFLSKKNGTSWVWHKTKYFRNNGYDVVAEGRLDNEKHLFYVSGADGLAAIKTINSFMGNVNNGPLHFIHKDHLGSYQCISNSSGTLLEELSFNSWGRRRKGTDWENYTLTSTPIFDRGFTGHEHLPYFNIVNINGRLYDPLVGRFLSPDYYVQATYYTQSYNRYSYCLNNPLVYTDRSKELSFLATLAIVWAGNNEIGWLDNINNKEVNPKDAFKNTSFLKR